MTRSPRPTPWVVFLALVLAAALRVQHVRMGGPHDMAGLSARYHATARHLLAGDGFVLGPEAPTRYPDAAAYGNRRVVGPERHVPYVDRFPGTVLVMAVLQWLVGTERAALAMAHGVLASVTVVYLARAGARLFRPAAGHAAAFLYAAWPPAWKSDTQLLETGTCTLAIAALVDTLLEFRERPTGRGAAALALWSTALVALRPDNLFIPLVVVAAAGAGAAWPARRWLAAVLLLPVLLLVPWAVRNGRVSVSPPFVSLGLGVNLLAAVGESATDAAPLFGDREVARHEGHQSLYWPDPARRDAARVRRALSLIREHPVAYLRGCALRVPVLLSLHAGEIWPGGPTLAESVAAWRERHPGRPRYAGLLAATASHLREHPARALLTLGWGPLLWLLAVPAALALRGRTPEILTLLALPAAGLLVHLPLHAEPRYFLPFAAPLFVLAGRTLVGGGPWARRARPRKGLDAPEGQADDARPLSESTA